MYQFGFIGCGNMGGALACAVAKSGESLAISGKDPEKTARRAKALSATVLSNTDIAKNCRFLILGVKPQVMPAVLSEIAPVLQEREDEFCLVSMAAGLTIGRIGELSGISCPIIRIMPNTPCQAGQGLILYSKNSLVTDAQLDAFLKGFSPAGQLEELEEKLMDAASAISGCGPAFAYMFIEALADGGVQCGLPREKAQLFAAKMLMGSGAMVLETGSHPGLLKDAVCSPGGSTIEGVKALENGTFRGAVMDAVTAAYEKTVTLGK